MGTNHVAHFLNILHVLKHREEMRSFPQNYQKNVYFHRFPCTGLLIDVIILELKIYV